MKDKICYFEIFFQLLTVTFIALKITGQISWSWIWVLSPLWIDYSPSIIVLIIGGVWWVKNRIQLMIKRGRIHERT